MRKQKYPLQFPFGRTLGLALILLIILLGLAEIGARTDFIRTALPAPSLGGPIQTLGIKFAYLNDLIKKEGHVDCIFVGSSMVLVSLDSEIFSNAYKTHTRKNIVCFNFGTKGFLPPAVAILTRILTEKYQPKLIVWGLSPISFSNKVIQERTKKLLMNIPWSRYRLGDFNVEGWLSDISYAYRYYLRFRIWMEQPEYSKALMRLEPKISRYGRRVKRSNKLTALVPKKKKISKVLEKLTNFKLPKKATDAMEQLMQLDSQENQVQVIIVEIPVHKRILSLYGRGSKDHYRTISYINKRVKHHGIFFIPTMHLNLIPDEGWSNLNHMNNLGAQIFSSWLGEQIGQAVKKGLIKDPLE